VLDVCYVLPLQEEEASVRSPEMRKVPFVGGAGEALRLAHGN
jgi:hypothetical protein